jgi:hypothetical protein
VSRLILPHQGLVLPKRSGIVRCRMDPFLDGGLTGFFGGGRPPPSLYYTSTPKLGPDSTADAGFTNIFNNVDIGVARSDRYVVCCVAEAGAPRNFVSGTINGVALSLIGSEANNPHIWLLGAAVPTGTSVTVVVTGHNEINHALITWSLYDLESTTPTDFTLSEGVDPAVLDLDVLNGGVVLAAACLNGTTSASFSWTGATPRTIIDTTEGHTFQVADEVNVSAAAPRTVRADASSVPTQIGALSVSYR